MAIPQCNCSEPAVEKTVMKESENKGRKFYSCRDGKDGCGFFEWMDDNPGGSKVVPSKRPASITNNVSLLLRFLVVSFVY
jgi:DNA topoisomerase-3